MPDVFTRASEYADWVDQQMSGAGSPAGAGDETAAPGTEGTETEGTF